MPMNNATIRFNHRSDVAPDLGRALGSSDTSNHAVIVIERKDDRPNEDRDRDYSATLNLQAEQMT